jgi:hypothetical protein
MLLTGVGLSYERGTDFSKDMCLKEAMQYYFLLKHIKNYDKANEYILPAMADIPHKMQQFFDGRLGYIEIVRDARLERCYFQLHDACAPGGELNRKTFDEMFQTDQREEFDSKSKDYLLNMMHIVEKVQFHEKIRNGPFAFTVKQWDLIRQINFMWTFTLHILLVMGGYMPASWKEHYLARIAMSEIAFVDEGERRKAKSTSSNTVDNKEFNLTRTDIYFFDEIEPVVEDIARVMNWINLFTCGLRLFAFAWSEMPIVVRRALEELEGEEEEELEDAPFVDAEEEEDGADAESVFVENVKSHHHDLPASDLEGTEDKDTKQTHDVALGAAANWTKILTVTLLSPICEYEFMFTVFPVLAIVFDEPLFSVYALFEICSWKGAQLVIAAISTNLPKMAQALLLGLLFMYTWMVLGMVLLADEHKVDTCSNMFQCFFSYLFKTIRDNGVKEMLTDPGEDFAFPHNIVDAAMGDGQFLMRMVWDLSFQIIFIYILVAIITGIVIDGFGDLKAEREAGDDDLKSICFVCHLNRFQCDQDGIGFDKHIKIEHNPKAYLFFLIYLQRKDWVAMSGQEKYIYNKVWPESGKPDVKWFPREQTFTIAEEAEEDTGIDLRTLASNVEGMGAKLDSLATTLASAVTTLARMEASMAAGSRGDTLQVTVANSAAPAVTPRNRRSSSGAVLTHA